MKKFHLHIWFRQMKSCIYLVHPSSWFHLQNEKHQISSNLLKSIKYLVILPPSQFDLDNTSSSWLDLAMKNTILYWIRHQKVTYSCFISLLTLIQTWKISILFFSLKDRLLFKTGLRSQKPVSINIYLSFSISLSICLATYQSKHICMHIMSYLSVSREGGKG